MNKVNDKNIYKVMLVDDDLLVIDDIKALINWEEIGMKISVVCENGKNALDLLPKVNPNIIIADIAMPIINGLEFSEKALEYDKSIKIILLTAYSKFDYAKKAISMGVVNYILKHELDEYVLKNELLKVKSELDDELKRETLNRRKVLEDFLTNPLSHLNKQQFEKNIYSTISGIKSYFISISVNKSLKIKNQSQYSHLISKNTYVSLINSIGMNNSEEGLEAIFLPISNYKVVALIYEKTRVLSENSLNQKVFNFVSYIKNEINKIFEDTANVFISSICNNSMDIPDEFKKVCDISNYGIFFQNTGVFYYSEIINMISNDGIGDNDLNKLREVCMESDTDRIKKVVENIWENYCVKKYDIKALKDICEELRNILNKKDKLSKMRIKNENVFFVRGDECKNTYELLKLFYSCLDEIDGYSKDEYSYKTAAVIDFIHKEYTKQITIDDVACKLGLNGEYLNKLFKKEFNKSFTKYLTEYRMEIAKELLESGKYKIYEVSEMVGYRTTQYFSSIFKKVNGITPSDCIK